jgi:glycerol-3-phosphate dehydrogenase
VVNRSVPHGYAIALATETHDADSIIDRGGRHLFVVGWRGYTLVGVWHKVFDGTPEQIVVNRQEIDSFVIEVNQAYPGLGLRMKEIMLINTGLTLFGEEGRQSERSLSFGKRSLLIDHQRSHGLKGLMTLIGVRATTARGMAAKTIDSVMEKLGKVKTKSESDRIPICGGRIESVSELFKTVLRRHSTCLSEDQVRSIVHNYGSEYMAVVQYANEDASLAAAIGKSATLKAEVIHAIREEMAHHLTDVVFRRTDLGTGKIPDGAELRSCADIMAGELGWDSARIEKEIRAVGKEFHSVNIND